MLYAIVVISVLGLLEQLIGTLDTISTIRKQLVMNGITVGLGCILAMLWTKAVIDNSGDTYTFIAIVAAYTIVSSVTSILVIHYYDKIRIKMKKRKLQANMAKARAVRWEVDYRDVEERCETLTEGEGR